MRDLHLLVQKIWDDWINIDEKEFFFPSREKTK